MNGNGKLNVENGVVTFCKRQMVEEEWKHVEDEMLKTSLGFRNVDNFHLTVQWNLEKGSKKFFLDNNSIISKKFRIQLYVLKKLD